MFPRINGENISHKKKPSPYHSLTFNSIRLAQFLSAAIVASVLIFFVHHLRIEHFYIPWTFSLLLTVSLLTLVSLFTTGILHSFGTLNPRHNFIANAFLSILWILGLSFLTWNLGWTLGHRCVHATWHNEAGIMVCRLYKALTAFTVTGLFSTATALLLDFYTQKKTTQLGTYNQMLDLKAPTDIRSNSSFHQNLSAQDVSGGNTSHDLSGPYRVQRPIEAQQFGYSVPSEQTSYAGGGGHGW